MPPVDVGGPLWMWGFNPPQHSSAPQPSQHPHGCSAGGGLGAADGALRTPHPGSISPIPRIRNVGRLAPCWGGRGGGALPRQVELHQEWVSPSPRFHTFLPSLGPKASLSGLPNHGHNPDLAGVTATPQPAPSPSHPAALPACGPAPAPLCRPWRALPSATFLLLPWAMKQSGPLGKGLTERVTQRDILFG